ncbi:MAG: PIG-L family deacetylase [Candidatus Omnitrophica bacterium]|nr:PIG-L family deacetylase [Candidatus Omnitrophota bacterium]
MKPAHIISAVLIAIICLFIPAVEAEWPDIGAVAPQLAQIEPVKKEDRILILAPHPDDESIGAAGIIQKAVKAGAEVKVMYLTNGEHNQLAFIVYEKRFVIKQKALIAMGKVRQAEAISAMKFLGVPEENLIFLGYPDFGMLEIFLNYWGDRKPFKNMLSRVSQVPYENALTPNAPYKGEAVLWDIESALKKYKPTKIFVTNPVDTNRDHRAYYLFLQVALWNLKGKIPPPKIHEYLIHCYTWPVPRNYHPELYLPVPQPLKQSSIQWETGPLTDEEVERKYQAIHFYKSQRAESAFYLDAFARKNELFGSYPAVELDEASALPLAIATTFRNKTVAYGKTNDELIISMFLGIAGNPKNGFYVYLAPYSPSIDFSEMPKFKINVKEEEVRVYRFGKSVDVKGMQVERKKHSITLKIPLRSLQDPEYVLASVGTYTSNYPSDLNAWRLIELK